MLAVTREKLMEHLLEVPELASAYARRDPGFVEQVLTWLGGVEQTLSRLRSPLVSLAAAQRATLVAAADGLREPQIHPGSSDRKAVRATASVVLARTEAALRQAVAAADAKLDEAREKLAQLLAVATAAHPLPLPPTEPRALWLEKVWQGLAVNSGTQGMYTYLGAAFSASDRLYVLDELLTNLTGAGLPSTVSGFSAPSRRG